jgi:hypothetical protein
LIGFSLHDTLIRAVEDSQRIVAKLIEDSSQPSGGINIFDDGSGEITDTDDNEEWMIYTTPFRATYIDTTMEI